MEQCPYKKEDCENLAKCYLERVASIQQRLRAAEEKNEETFNGLVKNLAAELEKPPSERRVGRRVYEEVIALRREMETASKICTLLDQKERNKLKEWLGEE